MLSELRSIFNSKFQIDKLTVQVVTWFEGIEQILALDILLPQMQEHII